MKIFFAVIVVLLFFKVLNLFSSSDRLKVGDIAPDFKLSDANGIYYTLSSFKDKTPVVIYFYPKANTPGCTKQACGIRDDWSKFEKENIPVFGISVDSRESIREFVEKYSLNFPLLSDESKTVSKAYGVLSPLGFSKRVTFIIDKEGKIAHILEKVDVNTHSKEVFDLAVKLK